MAERIEPVLPDDERRVAASDPLFEPGGRPLQLLRYRLVMAASSPERAHPPVTP